MAAPTPEALVAEVAVRLVAALGRLGLEVFSNLRSSNGITAWLLIRDALHIDIEISAAVNSVGEIATIKIVAASRRARRCWWGGAPTGADFADYDQVAKWIAGEIEES